jgi:hypothetical protein
MPNMDEMNRRWTQMNPDFREFRILPPAFSENLDPCPL